AGANVFPTAVAPAPAIGNPVRTPGMPRHPNKERSVVTVVGRPPVVRRCHHLLDVRLQGIHVKFLELLRIVEILAHRIGDGRVRVENREVELIRPPILVRPGPSPFGSRGRNYWVLAFAAVRHIDPSPFWLFPATNGRERGLS